MGSEWWDDEPSYTDEELEQARIDHEAYQDGLGDWLYEQQRDERDDG